MILGIDENVLWLEIPVHNPIGMDKLKCGYEFSSIVLCQFQRQRFYLNVNFDTFIY